MTLMQRLPKWWEKVTMEFVVILILGAMVFGSGYLTRMASENENENEKLGCVEDEYILFDYSRCVHIDEIVNTYSGGTRK